MGDRRLEITVPEQVVGALGLGDADLARELLARLRPLAVWGRESRHI